MSTDERICAIALTLCPGLGHVGAKRLMDEVGSAVAVFENRKELPQMVSLNPRVVDALDCPEAFSRAEKELNFAEKNRVCCLTFTDAAYPSRLRECPDAPMALFFKGKADLNCRHVVAMVGTRRATDYGRLFCDSFVRDMAGLCPDVLVVSGLAYGIDIRSHRAALQNHLPTVAVLAHGLDRIYPYQHRSTAVEMLENGGLLTEYLTGTTPDPYNFVSRNRIVAGVADATIVVESAQKGGSLITAYLANAYNRDCFAVPGRVTDVGSVGCNRLVRDNKAALIENATDFLNAMGWMPEQAKCRPEAVQRSVFTDLNEDENKVVRLLSQVGDLSINMMSVQTNWGISKLSAVLFELEMKGVVKPLPGSMYHLL